VTQIVTKTPDCGGPGATASDCYCALPCGDQTFSDRLRRNCGAWPAEDHPDSVTALACRATGRSATPPDETQAASSQRSRLQGLTLGTHILWLSHCLLSAHRYVHSNGIAAIFFSVRPPTVTKT
jgi:hypothetical protein